MKIIKRILLSSILSLFGLVNLSIFNTASAQSVYNDVLSKTVNSWSLASAINWWDVVTDATWADLFNRQIMNIMGYIIDIFIVVWIIMAFIGWYKIMMSSEEKSLKEWINLILFGVIWIIIMVSARFLAEWLVWDNGIITDEFTSLSDDNQPNWVDFAAALYSKILYPFIKIVLYFAVWFLFFMMVWRVFGYVTSTDDSVKKKALWVIIRCIVWILIIMWSKQLVEAVMWKQNEVLNSNAEWISDQTNGSILNFGSIPLVTQVINRVMWLTMFIVLVLILIQWYKMFTKPDDPKNRESLKKTLLYVIIWVLVIWAAYAISNVLVINNIPITTS